MVAEAIPDTETQASDATAEGAITGDAANQNTDAAASSASDPAEADVQAFIDAGKEGADGASKEAGEGKADDVDPLIKEAAEAAAKAASEKAERETRDRVAREEEQRKQAERARADKAAFDRRYDERMANVGAKLEQRLIELGVSPADAKRIADDNATDFNSHHADGLKLHEERSFGAAESALLEVINQTFREDLGAEATKFFGENNDRGHDGFGAALKAYREIVTDGMVTKADAEAEKKLALLAYDRSMFSEDDGKRARERLAGRRSGQTVNGIGGGQGERSFSNEDELNTAWNNREISREHFAREKERLTGRALD